MKTAKTHYFTYRITDLFPMALQKYYYGYKSCKCHPSECLGITYFSSSKDKEFISRQKERPANFKYKILKIFTSKEDALNHEIFLHTKFKVGKHPNFYNRACQTSTGFSAAGKVCVKDKNGNILQVNKTDAKYISNELVPIAVGKVVVKDKNGNFFQVNKEDPDYISRKLVGMAFGKVTVKDEDGNSFQTCTDDPKYISGELTHINTGRNWINNGKIERTEAPEYSEILIKTGQWFKGRLKCPTAGKIWINNGYIDKLISPQEITSLLQSKIWNRGRAKDPGKFKGHTKGRKWITNGKINKLVSVEEANSLISTLAWRFGINK